jgi:hypothetical protein
LRLLEKLVFNVIYIMLLPVDAFVLTIISPFILMGWMHLGEVQGTGGNENG